MVKFKIFFFNYHVFQNLLTGIFNIIKIQISLGLRMFNNQSKCWKHTEKVFIYTDEKNISGRACIVEMHNWGIMI